MAPYRTVISITRLYLGAWVLPSMVLSLVALLAMLPLGVAAKSKRSASVKVGYACSLTKSVRLSAKRSGRGKRSKVAAGDSLAVVRQYGSMLKVKSKRRSGYIRAKDFAKVCVPDTGESLPADAGEPPGKFTGADGDATQEQGASIEQDREVAGRSGEEAARHAEPPPAVTSPDRSAFGETSQTKIAVMDLRGANSLSDEIRVALSSAISETLGGLGPFRTITSADIQQMLQMEAQKQMFGCDEMSCFAEIGAALGADYMVSGAITEVGGIHVIQMQLVSMGRGRVEARVAREYEGDTRGLFGEMRTASKVLVRDLLGMKQGKLGVTVSELGATIRIDGSIVGVSPMQSMDLAGGVHTVTVERQGFVTAHQDVQIGQSRETQINIQLLPSADFIDAYRESSGFTRSMSWTGLGLGVLAAGVGGALYYSAGIEAERLNHKVGLYNNSTDRPTDWKNRLDDREARLAQMEIGAMGAAAFGVVALTTGILMRALGDDPDRYDDLGTQPSTTPTLNLQAIGASGFGASYSASF